MSYPLAGVALSFLPDWSDGVTERLEFRTDIIRSRDGTEERRVIRSAPRITLDYGLLLTRNEAAFLQNVVYRKGWEKLYTPFWPYTAPLTSDVTAGSSTVLLSTTERPFRVGGMVMISQGLAGQQEVGEVDVIGGSSLTLVDVLGNPWSQGSYVTPCGRAFFSDGFELSIKSITSNVSSTRLSMLYDPSESPIDLPTGSYSTSYQGSELWLHEPNWKNEFDLEIKHYVSLVDKEIGTVSAPDQQDAMARSPEDSYEGTWFLNGKAAINRFREFCLRRKGKAVGFWCPSWRCDFQVTAAIGASDTVVETKNNYAPAPTPGRRDIIIWLKNGTYFTRRITNVVDNGDGTQDITLSSSLGQAVPVADVKRISYLNWSRLGSDTVEISWKNPEFAEGKISIAAVAER